MKMKLGHRIDLLILGWKKVITSVRRQWQGGGEKRGVVRMQETENAEHKCWKMCENTESEVPSSSLRPLMLFADTLMFAIYAACVCPAALTSTQSLEA